MQPVTWLFVLLMAGGVSVMQAQAAAVSAPEPHVYSPGEVDVPAKVIDDGIGPHYPDALRPLGLDGIVVAQFVIDTAGRADTSSVLTDGSQQPLFIAAVHEALTRMHFTPAQKEGKKVFAEVEESFTFRADVPRPVNTDSIVAALMSKSRIGPPRFARGSARPVYPEKELRAGYSAIVSAEFMIDSTGHIVTPTFKVVSVRTWRFDEPSAHDPRKPMDLGIVSPDKAFVAEVRRALPLMIFIPAEKDGHHVPQRVQMPFSFTISH